MRWFAGRIRRVVEGFIAALSRSAASGSKTTALAPLHGVLALCLGSALAAVWLQAPPLVVWLFVAFSGLVLILEVGAYLYLLVRDRDALRSERYSLEKMRLERGLMGDSLTGVSVVPQGRANPMLPSGRSDESG